MVFGEPFSTQVGFEEGFEINNVGRFLGMSKNVRGSEDVDGVLFNSRHVMTGVTRICLFQYMLSEVLPNFM